MKIEVSLHDFDDSEIEEYATDVLGMITSLDTLECCLDEELVEELEKRGYSVVDKHYYPHNSIIDQDLIIRFNEGFSKINNKDLEEFLINQGL